VFLKPVTTCPLLGTTPPTVTRHGEQLVQNSTGRVSQVWPFLILDFWKLTPRPDPESFVFS
jgi:hypothetical protein